MDSGITTPFYSLINKILRRVFIVGALTLGILGIAGYAVLDGTFLDLEESYAKDKLQLVDKIITVEAHSLKTVTFDYSNWDKTYLFTIGKNKKYAANDLRTDDLKTLHVDHAVIINPLGKVIHTQSVDPKTIWTSSKSIVVTELVTKHISKMKTVSINIVKSNSKEASPYMSLAVATLAQIDDTPWLITIAPILSYDKPPTQNGWLVFMREFDIADIKDLRTRTGVNFELHKNTDNKLPLRIEASDRKVTGFMPTTLNTNLAIHTVAAPRWEAQHDRTYALLFGGGLVLVAACLIMIYKVVERTVLYRLTKITQSVADMPNYISYKNLPLQAHMHDELDVLSSTINTLLKKIQETNSVLRYQSEHDTLTDLGNRRALHDHLNNLHLKQKLETLSTYAVLMLDLDDFKPINDTYGHERGDYVLQVIAKRFKDNIKRPEDAVFRLGGDEFAIVLQDTDIKGALIFATYVQTWVTETIPDNFGNLLKVGTSIGISICEHNKVDTPAKMLAQADEAMYQAKKLGKTQIAIYQAT